MNDKKFSDRLDKVMDEDREVLDKLADDNTNGISIKALRERDIGRPNAVVALGVTELFALLNAVEAAQVYRIQVLPTGDDDEIAAAEELDTALTRFDFGSEASR